MVVALGWLNVEINAATDVPGLELFFVLDVVWYRIIDSCSWQFCWQVAVGV